MGIRRGTTEWQGAGSSTTTANELFHNMCGRVQPAPRQRSNLTVMTRCGYCGQRATTTIVATPEQVCSEHALEFWSGLLTYAGDRRGDGCCVKLDRLCSCRSCEELAEFYVRCIATDSGQSFGNAARTFTGSPRLVTDRTRGHLALRAHRPRLKVIAPADGPRLALL